MMFAVLMMMAATSFAQDAVPATKIGENKLDKMLEPLMEKLKDVADDDDEQAAKIIFDFAKENPNEAGVYVITNLPRSQRAHTCPCLHSRTVSSPCLRIQPRSP